QRTRLVGQNRLELLLFRLNGRQLYGINVFKVKEVLQCPRLTAIPRLNPMVRGVAHIRGGTLPIIDLGRATGGRALEDRSSAVVRISAPTTRVRGSPVRAVARFGNLNWSDVQPPPRGTGRDQCLTAVARVDEQLGAIGDVETVPADVVGVVDP